MLCQDDGGTCQHGEVDGEVTRPPIRVWSSRQANTEFHSTIVRACGNDLSAESIVGVLEKIERVHQLAHLLRDRNEQASTSTMIW